MTPDDLDPTITEVLRFFDYEHLSQPMRGVSRSFATLASGVAVRTLNGSSVPETVVALRKLLEAKDAAVRAMLPTPSSEGPVE